jgi:hypothetical protein
LRALEVKKEEKEVTGGNKMSGRTHKKKVVVEKEEQSSGSSGSEDEEVEEGLGLMSPLKYVWDSAKRMTRSRFALWSRRETDPSRRKRSKKSRSKVRPEVVQEGTNVLTAVQPVVTSAVVMRARSPLGRPSGPPLSPIAGSPGDLSLNGSYVQRRRAETQVSQSYKTPVMSVTGAGVEGIPEEDKMSRREQRTNVKDAVTTQVEGTCTKQDLEWDYDPGLNQAQQTGDQSAQKGETETQGSQAVEQTEDRGQESEDSKCEVERNKISSKEMYMPLDEYYGYVLLDLRVDERYSYGRDAETKWINLYDWKDLAVLLTKELHGELLIKLWENLLVKRNIPRVDPDQNGLPGMRNLEEELAGLREKAGAFASQLTAERAKTAETEGRAKGANKLRAQLQLRVQTLEGEKKECELDTQDDIRRFEILKGEKKALLAQVVQLREEVELAQAQVASLEEVTDGPAVSQQEGKETNKELQRLHEIIVSHRQREMELVGQLEQVQQPPCT